MKTLQHRTYGQVIRKSDDEAAEIVRLNYGWAYCPKSRWKERRGDSEPDQ